MQIQIDITDVAGPKLSDLRNIGLVPEALDGRNLHVSNPSGSRIVVRDYEDDSVVLASGNGWSNAMQALADHYGVPVQVSRDFGVTGGKSGKVLGLWTPATPADTATPTPALPKLNKAQVDFMRRVEAKNMNFTPSNHEWAAPSHAHRDMFTTYNKGRKSNRTIVGTAVFHMDLIDIEGRAKIVLTELGLAWLAANPA